MSIRRAVAQANDVADIPRKRRVRTLPAPLTFYVRIKLLSESHLRRVAKLKDVFGPGLLRDLSLWKWSYPPADDTVVWAAIMLNTIRPEERAVACVHPVMMKDYVVRGCETFASYVMQHGLIVPQWVVAAFWWESIAAQGEISADDLALLIEGWKDRFHDAVSWWAERGTKPSGGLPNAQNDSFLRWRVYRDLWHSGSLEEQIQAIRPMLK